MNRLGDSGVHTLGDNSAFVNPAGQLLLTRRGKTRMDAVGIVFEFYTAPQPMNSTCRRLLGIFRFVMHFSRSIHIGAPISYPRLPQSVMSGSTGIVSRLYHEADGFLKLVARAPILEFRSFRTWTVF